jgi:dihydrofolate reductase
MPTKKNVSGATGAADESRKLVAQIFATIDEAMDRTIGEFMSQPYELLLGRKTYDIFAAYWPNHPEVEPAASSLNRATKYVASRTTTTLDWENAHLLQGDAAAAVKELKRRAGPPIHVVGSSHLLQTLLKHDLVDELELRVFPIVLGSGKRLFDDGTIPTA